MSDGDFTINARLTGSRLEDPSIISWAQVEHNLYNSHFVGVLCLLRYLLFTGNVGVD